MSTNQVHFDLNSHTNTTVLNTSTLTTSGQDLPTIQYDMAPFQNNENWAIFDPTSLPPGVNFSDFGPIIELPIDSKVEFTNTNQVGFKDMFSQAVSGETNAIKTPVNGNNLTAIKEQTYSDVTNLTNDNKTVAVETKTKDVQLVGIYQINQSEKVAETSLNNANSFSNQPNVESTINTKYNRIETVIEKTHEPSFGVVTGPQTKVDIPPPPPI
jgi:hypothetical protein